MPFAAFQNCCLTGYDGRVHQCTNRVVLKLHSEWDRITVLCFGPQLVVSGRRPGGPQHRLLA